MRKKKSYKNYKSYYAYLKDGSRIPFVAKSVNQIKEFMTVAQYEQLDYICLVDWVRGEDGKPAEDENGKWILRHSKKMKLKLEV